MAEKTYFEQLQEEAAAAKAKQTERGPELPVGPHQFTVIGGTHGNTNGHDWSAVVMRHTNGHEYRIFYHLYWALKEGELEPSLNVNVFDWICAFDKEALAAYKENDFDKYFDALAGKSFVINYVLNKKGKVVVDFSQDPIPTDILEEELTVDEIDFDSIE